MLRINTINQVILDGQVTKFTVYQDQHFTQVFFMTDVGEVFVDMPKQRYSLSHDAPASGVAGRTAFERDIRNIIQGE